jgi:crotonobetainyl-CoA:carnitine CoA-transferase CaiB-like acyl-CoA transferase
VLSYRDAMRHPHVEARGMLLTDSEGQRHLNTPLRFAREPGQPTLRVPALGEHTAARAALRNDA